MEVNGREYPMWGQFVEKQKQWIGGILEDWDEGNHAITEITGISLEKNGEDSAYFSIIGKDFQCGFDVGHGGIGKGDEGWITFSGYAGHTFRIATKENATMEAMAQADHDDIMSHDPTR